MKNEADATPDSEKNERPAMKKIQSGELNVEALWALHDEKESEGIIDNRYFMFAYNIYYPGGGMDDIYKISNDRKIIEKYIKDWKSVPHHDTIQVYDSHLNEVVYQAEGYTGYDYIEDTYIHRDKIVEKGSWVGEPIKEKIPRNLNN